jgi:hypothetical protein
MDDLTLTEAEVYLSKEWVMDSAPLRMARIDPEIIKAILLIKIESLARVSELESQAKLIEHEMFNKMAKLLG